MPTVVKARKQIEYTCAGCGVKKMVDVAQLPYRDHPLMCAACSRKRSMFNKTTDTR